MRTKTLKTLDPRLQDCWEISSFKKIPKIAGNGEVAIVSYADDEGVRLNRGRPGAAKGPERILFYLGRLVHQLEGSPRVFILSDKVAGKTLLEKHRFAETMVKTLLERHYRVITLGGGHDYGFSDATAYFETFGGHILNVDAHLDLRPVVGGSLHSGTPFFRFVEKFGGQPLIEWGIQIQANAKAHMDFARKNRIKLAGYRSPLPEIEGNVGLSICLDAFAGIQGVSAPALVGLLPDQGLQTLERYSQQSSWLGLYECAPRYDPLNEDSARLAAVLAYRFLHPHLAHV